MDEHPPPGPAGADPSPTRSNRMPGIPLGRVGGIPVTLTASWLVLAVMITFVYGGYVLTRRPEMSPTVAYLIGFGMVLCLLVSVFLHELGHALTARSFGIGVRGITLEMLGGYTEMDRDAPTPRVELAVSLIGPVVSFVLGLLAALVVLVVPTRGLFWELAAQLAFSNLLVGAFNALPGLPLDGGRALRAGIWAISRDRNLGDRVAGRAGRVVAVVSVLAAVLLYRLGYLTWIAVLLIVLVAVTLWTGATQAIRLGRMGDRLPAVNAGQLARPMVAVVSGTPLAEAQRRYAEALAAGMAAPGAGPAGATGPADPADHAKLAGPANPARPNGGRPAPVLVVVDSAGQLLGVVDETAASAVPPERRPWVSVETVSRDIDRDRVIPAELSGMAVVQAVQAHPASEYVVILGEDVVGVLRVADLVHVLEPRE